MSAKKTLVEPTTCVTPNKRVSNKPEGPRHKSAMKCFSEFLRIFVFAEKFP